MELTPKKYIEAFDSLFTRWQDHYFCGSLEMARLLMQIMTGRFISQQYLSFTMKSFISAGLVEKTGRVAKIGLVIGPFEFKPHDRQVYRRLYPADRAERMAKLEQNFENVMDFTDELVKKSDIELLRSLESEKGSLGWQNNHKDREWEYRKSRTSILNAIAKLEAYDRNEARERTLQRNALEEEYRAKYWSWAEQIKLLLERCVAVSEMPIVDLAGLPIYGTMRPKKLYFSEDGMNIEGTEFGLTVPFVFQGITIEDTRTIRFDAGVPAPLGGSVALTLGKEHEKSLAFLKDAYLQVTIDSRTLQEYPYEVIHKCY